MSSDDPLRAIGRGRARLHVKLSRLEERLGSGAAVAPIGGTPDGAGEHLDPP